MPATTNTTSAVTTTPTKAALAQAKSADTASADTASADTRTGLLKGPLNPLKLIKQAIKQEPIARYALVMVAFAVGAFLAKDVLKSPWLALLGTVAAILISVILVLLSRLDKLDAIRLRWQVHTFAWFTLLAIMVSILLLLSSFFVQWPLDLKEILHEVT